ncbi:MAG TPA: TIGR02587 family membrane protein, partial [Longimicrobiaceae bacterium]|nr:TIGR02587 family membrane protein [Longimicrobiaceae bacterium]
MGDLTATQPGVSPRDFLVGLARAFGGAIFFALPLLMTMEMWRLGYLMNPFRLALFMVVMIPMLVGLSHFSGFKETQTWTDDVVDAFVAYGVGFIASAVVLLLFDVLRLTMGLNEIVGMVSIQAIPASFGASLAASQLHGSDDKQTGRKPDNTDKKRQSQGGYGTEIFLMAAGAVFLAFNVAPTEEMILIAYKMSQWHALALTIASLVMMHAFVYAVDFKGAHAVPEGTPPWRVFLRYTTVGYAVALLISAYVLWTFGRFEGQEFASCLMMTIVL